MNAASGLVIVIGDVMTDVIVIPEGPLVRGSDGSLGIAGGGGGVTVNFNVTTPNPRSFTQSQAEVSAMLLRAVKRGTRAS